MHLAVKTLYKKLKYNKKYFIILPSLKTNILLKLLTHFLDYRT